LRIVLESLILYYRGETRAITAIRTKERFGITVPLRTLSGWLADFLVVTLQVHLRCQKDRR
jgi:hypothetical protein